MQKGIRSTTSELFKHFSSFLLRLKVNVMLNGLFSKIILSLFGLAYGAYSIINVWSSAGRAFSRECAYEKIKRVTTCTKKQQCNRKLIVFIKNWL